MYKLLLCWRYLRTRYIALASIISVMLGVATMIVVNSVMAGFTHEMQDRIHGIISDVVFESRSLEGFSDPQGHMDEINRVAGQYIAGMTPTVHVPAMLSFQVHGQWVQRQVNFIGIDEATYSTVGDFGNYLQHPGNRERLSFQLRDGGYDTVDHQAEPDAPPRVQMSMAGWPHRRRMAQRRQLPSAGEPPSAGATNDPFQQRDREVHPEEGAVFDPVTEQHPGVVIGIALSSFRVTDGSEGFRVLPGDDVQLSVPTTGTPPRVASWKFTIVDFYESKMSEYDASFVFAPIAEVQKMRGMFDRAADFGNATSIQIRLKEGVDLDMFRDQLRAHFPPQLYSVETWRDKQGPLLAAVQMETAILNVLLFLIIAVAGFGILAIFYMIVVEKTRDIGILKALGASGHGILSIFLGYGLSLGMVGSGVGMAMGLLFVVYINEIADLLSWLTGKPLFDPAIYYFQSIPTIIEPMTVAWIVFGAVLIAVMASILPARRAARLHPVEALRHE